MIMVMEEKEVKRKTSLKEKSFFPINMVASLEQWKAKRRLNSLLTTQKSALIRFSR
jgi:hypothetical protein